MSLDITIMNESGTSKTVVSLTVDEHWALVQQAKQMVLPLWTRMSDYYADVDYDVGEVSALAAETTHLLNACRDFGLLAKLKEIEEMLNMAIEGHNSISVIAD